MRYKSLLPLLVALSIASLSPRQVASTAAAAPQAAQPARQSLPATKPGGMVAVLNEPEMPVRGAKSLPQTIGKILEDAGIKVQLLSADQLADPGVLKPSAFDLVVLPTGQTFPSPARNTFIEYLRAGGGFITTGGYAFNDLLAKRGGKWRPQVEVTEAEVREALASGNTLLADGGFEKSQEAPLGKSPGEGRWYCTSPRCTVTGEGPRGGRFCAKVEAPPGGALGPTEFRAEFAPRPGMVYHASGWLKTADVEAEPIPPTRLAYLAIYQFDGEERLVAFKHFTMTSGTVDWSQYALDFAADRRAVRIELRCGIYRAHGTAWFDDLQLVQVPSVQIGPLNTATGTAGNMLGLAPEQIGIFDACFPLKRVCSMRTAPGQQVVREPIDIRAELAGWGASGIVGDYTNDGIRYLRRQVVTNARWTPLLETYDRYGRPRGAAAALMLNHGGFYAGSNWAYFGVENVDLFKDPSSPMAKALQEVARFLVRGTFLRQVATEFRLYRPGETVKASAVVDNRGGRAQPVSVRFTVSAVDSDAPTATVTEQVVLAPGASQEVQVALGPVASGPDLRRVACTLLADGAAIDELTTGFVVESAETVGSAAELRFAGNYFTRNGRAMFLFGSDETAYVYLTPHENPLTWSRDLLAARDIGMDIYENLQYSNPGHEMLEADWRNFRAMGQLIQKHNMVFMPGMLIVHNVAAGDAALAEQARQCQGYAENLAKMPGLLYYINGDYGNNPNEQPEETKKLWNHWLQERYGTTENLRAAWGADAAIAELGKLAYPPPSSDRWDDVPALDKSRFLLWLTERWNKAHVAAVRTHDTGHPITSEYYAYPFSGIDMISTIDGQDVANVGAFSPPPDLQLHLRWNDMRMRGKGLGMGEYGIQVHPAWTGEGGPGRDDPLMPRTEERQKQLFFNVAHLALGLGGSRIQNWCLRDAQARSVFPWGIFYPENMVPKDVAYAHRNLSIIWRHFTPKYVSPRLAVCIPNQMRLGNQSDLGLKSVYRTIGDLLALHYDFNVIDDDHLDAIDSTTKALIYGAPLAMHDEAMDRLVAWVEGGGTLWITGDFSRDANRQRSQAARLRKLAGVEWLAEHHAAFDRQSADEAAVSFTLPGVDPARLKPCIRVRPTGAEVLGKTAEGEPVLVRNRLGLGAVYFLTDPVELADGAPAAAVRRQLYRAAVHAAGIRPLVVEPDDPDVQVMAQPTAQGTIHVLYSKKSAAGAEELRIPTAAGKLTLAVRNGWSGLAAVTGDGRVVAVSADAAAVAETGTLMAGTGLKALLSLDGRDLRQSEAILVAPLEPGTLDLSGRPGARIAAVGEFQNGQWKTLERAACDEKSPILTIDEDQATCLILVCRPGEEARWAGELTRAVLRPETIQGY